MVRQDQLITASNIEKLFCEKTSRIVLFALF
jgi:hypothetical protein